MTVVSYDFSFTRKKRLKQKILSIICIFSILLLVLQFILLFLFSPILVTSSSMEPAIVQNSALFVLPLTGSGPGFLNSSAIERGSIVRLSSVYASDASGFEKIIDFVFGLLSFQQYRPFETSRGSYSGEEIYRVVGLPGDTLYINDYVAYIRQKGFSHFLTEFELSSIEYDLFTQDIPQNWDMSMGIQGNSEQIVLAEDEYFVLCDNRIATADSRLFGSVKEERINARALLQYFPFTDISVLY